MSPPAFRWRWVLAGLLLLLLGCNPGPTTPPRSDTKTSAMESAKTPPTPGGLHEPGHTPGT
jgi:hypothetical protein